MLSTRLKIKTRIRNRIALFRNMETSQIMKSSLYTSRDLRLLEPARRYNFRYLESMFISAALDHCFFQERTLQERHQKEQPRYPETLLEQHSGPVSAFYQIVQRREIHDLERQAVHRGPDLLRVNGDGQEPA